MPPVTDKEPAADPPKQRRRPGRVPVSCAECRRLKLRCDRKVPCETCTKRGCAAICPEGSLPTGRSNRGTIAGIEELHKDNDRLKQRAAQLEEALRQTQARLSDQPHPLLCDMNSPPSASGSGSGSSPESGWSASTPPDGPGLSKAEEEVLDSFGTLTLGLRGEARFFGQTSRSEYLIHAPAPSTVRAFTAFPHLSPELVHEAYMDIDVQCADFSLRDQIRGNLPTLSRAYRLCEIFLEFGQYIWYPLPREILFDEILGEIYRTAPSTDSSCYTCSHALSLTFAVFALATLFDMDAPPSAVEAHEYYLLSRMCLRYVPPLKDTTLIAIQSLIYQAQYLEMSDCEPAHTSSQKAWVQIGVACKLGHSIGLHVSGSRWKLDEIASQRRARVFWQLFAQDTWISFGFGRPPCMSMGFIDCELPKETDEPAHADGTIELGFHSWTWQFTKLLHTIIHAAFGAKPPSYSTVLDLDRKVRDFPVPRSLRHNCEAPEAERARIPPAQYMKAFLVMLCKESTLLSLHRPFFVAALNEQPADLLRHRYGPSVMAIYRSAWRSIEGTKELWKRVPQILARFGLTWSQCLAGGIVMCLLVTRAPCSPLARSALQELDSMRQLFESATETCQIASNNLDVVHKLYRQAHTSMTNTQNELLPCHELERLGGKTHLISSRSTHSMDSSEPTEATNAPASPSPPPTAFPPLPTEYVHPTIMQDMRSFETAEPVAPYQNPGTNELMFDFPPTGAGSHSTGAIPGLTTEYAPGQEVFDQFFAQNGFGPLFNNGVGMNGLGAHGMNGVNGVNGNGVEEPFGGPLVLDATWQSFVEQLGF